MSGSLANQVVGSPACLILKGWQRLQECCFLLWPQALDEKVASLHLPALCAQPSALNKEGRHSESRESDALSVCYGVEAGRSLRLVWPGRSARARTQAFDTFSVCCGVEACSKLRNALYWRGS
jgi:hypothetical protein